MPEGETSSESNKAEDSSVSNADVNDAKKVDDSKKMKKENIMTAKARVSKEGMDAIVQKEKEDAVKEKIIETAAQKVSLEIPDEFFEKVISQFSEAQVFLGDFSKSINKLPDEIKKSTENIPEALASIASSQSNLGEVLKGITSGETPEILKLPTLERLKLSDKYKDRLKDVTSEKDPEYHECAGDWFEDRLRHLESFDLSYEEQASLLSPLVYSVTHFELNPKTKELGESFRRKFEARRKRQRLVRIWAIAVPETISDQSSGIDNETFAELFTYEIKEEIEKPDGSTEKVSRKPIAEEFKNFESMGERLLEIREKINSAGSKEERAPYEDERDAQLKAIQEYYRHGGYVDEVGTIVELPRTREGGYKYLDQHLKELEKSGDEERAALIGETIWARKFAGGLFSITQRAGSYDIILNDLGDIFAGRSLNISEHLKKRGLLKKTRGIWDPKEGKYKDKPLDLGYTDFFSSLLSEAKEKRRAVKPEEKGIYKKWLKDVAGLSESDYGINTPIIGGEVDKGKESVKIHSLANANLGDEKFWKDIDDEFGARAKFSTHNDNFRKAYETVKQFWGANSYFHNPNLEKFLKLSEVFDHVAEGKRQEKWKDVLDRTVSWMDTDDAKEMIEELNIFPAAEKYRWIEQSSVTEMITNKQRDALFKEYLDSTWPGSPRSKAQRHVMIDTIKGIFRYPPMRNQILLGTFWEFLKRAFSYILSEDVKIR